MRQSYELQSLHVMTPVTIHVKLLVPVHVKHIVV